MNLNFTSPALMLALLFVFSGCASDEGKASDQAEKATKVTAAASSISAAKTIEKVAGFSRASDAQALFEASVPPQYAAWARDEWAKKMQEPITDEERDEFKTRMDSFTAPDAEKKMWASLEPELTKLQADASTQIPMMVVMGQGVLSSLVQKNVDLKESQKEQAIKAIDALGKWAVTTEFTDPLLAQKSIGIICATARKLKLESLDQLQALSLDQALAKAGIVFTGFKQVLDVYGLPVNKILDSVKAKMISEQGDTATVKVNYTLFDTPLDFETDMVKIDGRWYGKDSMNNLQKDMAKYERNKTGKVDAAAKPADDQ